MIREHLLYIRFAECSHQTSCASSQLPATRTPNAHRHPTSSPSMSSTHPPVSTVGARRQGKRCGGVGRWRYACKGTHSTVENTFYGKRTHSMMEEHSVGRWRYACLCVCVFVHVCEGMCVYVCVCARARVYILV